MPAVLISFITRPGSCIRAALALRCSPKWYASVIPLPPSDCPPPQVHELLLSSFSKAALAKFPLLAHQWPIVEKFR